jgi:YD repeat-containing protein
MQKKFRRSAAAFLLVAVFILPGCKKLLDYFEDHPDLRVCNIKEIRYGDDQLEISGNWIKFTYNSLGDPVSAIRRVAEYDAGNLTFFYDKHHRLIESFVRFATDSLIYNGVPAFTPWNYHKYYYDAYDRIVGDSVYVGPIISNGHFLLIHTTSDFFYTYKYDWKGRIIEKDFTTGGQPTISHRYFNYDAAGNLIKPGVVYDHNLNFLRTNKIWSFISQDYSLNNGFIADSYNSKGLPLLTSTAGNLHGTLGNQHGTPLFGGDFIEASFEYECP